jgi:hypothetical protein
VKGLLKLIAAASLFLACEAFFLLHEFIVGALSSPSLRVVVLALALVNIFAIAIGVFWLRKGAVTVQGLTAVPVSALDSETRKRRILAIRGLKIWIAGLMLGLVMGLMEIREHPWWASTVGITINLLLTASLARLVLQLQKTLK